MGSGTVPSDKQYWKSVKAGRERVQSLLTRAITYLDRLPQISRFIQQRERVARLLERLRPDRPASDQSRFARRARLITDGRNSQVNRFYRDFQSFVGEILAALEQLRNVLPSAEVDRLRMGVHPSAVDLTCQTVQRIAERLEEFWQCRPTSVAVKTGGDRESRLREFVEQNKTNIAAVTRAAQLYKPDMRKWRHNKLPDQSKISQRIEDVLSGRTRIGSASPQR
jgi:hypothetical protein